MIKFAMALMTCGALGGTLARAQTPVDWTNSATPTVPQNPGPIAVGDFDGDGNIDIAVASPTGVTILLGKGDGTFKAATTFAGQTTPQAIAVTAFRSGGAKDIIELSSSASPNNTVSVLFGDGHGSFSTPSFFSLPYGSATSVAVDDLNVDGKQDFVATCTQVGVVAIYNGKGDGTFNTPTLIPIAGGPTCVVTGNFGGRGHRDLAVADGSNASVDLFLNDGAGNFSQGVSASVGNDPISMVAGDFNGDGFQDLAVVNHGDNNVSILLGQANGSFRQNPITVSVGVGPTTIAAGDFNGDGKTDLVVSNSTGNTVSVLLGNGDGTFTISTPINIGATPTALTVGNFAGHGNVDLAVSVSNSSPPSKVFVFLAPTSQGPTPTPTPTGPTPTPTPLPTPTPTPVPTLIPTPTPLPVGSAPVITIGPMSQTVVPSTNVTFTVTAQGSSLSYQWQKDGAAMSGATSSSFSLSPAQASDSGLYTVVVTNSGGSVTSAPATLFVGTPLTGRIINMSVRSNAGTGSQTLIAGFIISGSGTKPVMIRGSGATLANFGLAGVNLTDPLLDLYQSSSLLSENDSWMSAPNQAQILAANGNREGAFTLDPKDAIILSALTANGYTAQVKSSNNGTGVALIEVNDTDTASPGTPEFAAEPRLTNISARSQVGTGGNILIAGFIINGNVPKRVMIRGSGPTLTNFGVTGVLPDPILKLYSGSTVIAQNDSWQSAPNLSEIMAANGQQEGPYTLDPKDTLMIVVLAPGGYTVQLSGVNNTTGVGLLEVFDLDP